jgi:immune inhibitor A
MRRAVAGLGSLAVVAGLTTALAVNAGAAAPPDGAPGQPNQVVADDLPNPAAQKRRALREEAIKDVIAGRAKVQQRGPSEVVMVG